MTSDNQISRLNDISGTPVKRKRGRPPGSKAKLTQSQLRTHHFSYVRALIQGIAPRKAWQLYLSHEGGPDDERHFAACLRQLQLQIQTAANDRGLEAVANTALAQFSSLPAIVRPSVPALPCPSAPPPPAPPIPSLDEWIAERCSGGEIDEDFYSHAEWIELYEDEFALHQAPGQVAATAIPDSRSGAQNASALPAAQTAAASSLDGRLGALNHLTMALAVPPALDDKLATWLSPDLSRRLALTEVNGTTVPLVTLEDLITFINQFHFRWWTKVPRLGKERGDRLLAWLEPIAESLGRLLMEIATRPLHQHVLAQQHAIETSDASAAKRYAVVPLDRLSVPPAIDGRTGQFRIGSQNLLGANTDLEAIFAWMRRHQDAPRTSATYGRIVERFYLWCVVVKRTTLSSLIERDFLEYRDFLIDPPATWIQARRTGRQTAEWRPFKGPVSASNLRLNFTVISGFFTALHKAGYLSVQAAASALRSMKMPYRTIHIERSFDNAQWGCILKYWQSLYHVHGPEAEATGELLIFPRENRRDRSFARASALRRIRLLLELGSTTGLRLIEMVNTRRASLREDTSGEHLHSVLQVQGRGGKVREVLILPQVKALLDQHHIDIVQSRTHFSTPNFIQRQQESLATKNAPPTQGYPKASAPLPYAVQKDHSHFLDPQIPLIGALRPPPPPMANHQVRVTEVNDKPTENLDKYEFLDPTALHQSLKRFLNGCCDMWAAADGDEESIKKLRMASTHWLRHLFAKNAADTDIHPSILMAMMGHASPRTSSIYLKTIRQRQPEDSQPLKSLT